MEILRLRALDSERASKFARPAAETGGIPQTDLLESDPAGPEGSLPANEAGARADFHRKRSGTTFSITREEHERARVKGFLADFYRENCSLELVVTYQDIRRVVLNAVSLAEEEFPDLGPVARLHS